LKYTEEMCVKTKKTTAYYGYCKCSGFGQVRAKTIPQLHEKLEDLRNEIINEKGQ
jgi:hypothetical protein